MYRSTEMLISVQKYKLQYGKISPILSAQITAPVQKNVNLSVQKHKLHSKHIHRFVVEESHEISSCAIYL